MLKVTVDTNVIISALLKKDSVPAKAMSYVLNNCQLYISRYILDELEEVLKRPKIRLVVGWDNNRIKRYLAGLEEVGILVKHPPVMEIVKEDPTDNNILACAVSAQVDYLITGDNHLIQLRRYEEIKIVSPSEFLMVCRMIGNINSNR